MSTRSQIAIYEDDEKDLNKPKVLIYRHHDGYPDSEHGVLANIQPFLEWFNSVRGVSDSQYAGARLLQYLCNKHDENTKESIKRYGSSNELSDEFTGSLGYGICRHFQKDIEFFYAVYPDRIEVYETEFDFNSDSDLETDMNERARLLKTIKLKTR